MIATAPRDKHKTKQDVETPEDLFRLLDVEFEFVRDLAATAENRKCADFITPEQNSLETPWAKLAGWQWLNPPFADIEPWLEKCVYEARRGAQLVVLVPASVGANWFRHLVEGKAEVRFLNGRVTFVGHVKPYPKDLMLCIYERGRYASMGTWDWRAKAKRRAA